MLERFRTFSAENFEKCLQCGHYPINNTRAIEWIKSQPAGCARGFAELFYASLQHISFAQWYTALCKMAVEIISKIELRGFNRVVLVVNGPMNKSNTMVAVMLFHHLGDRITDVVGDVLTDISWKPDANTLFLHADDCSYSGTQINSTITPYRGVVGDSVYVIACPYIGNAAYNVLKQHKWVKFTKSTVLFPSFQQQIESNSADYNCIDIANKSMDVFNGEMMPTFMYMDTLSAVYFDHKLADAMSIFQKVLALGPVFDGAAVGSLITGCESFQYKTDGKPADVNEPITDFDDDGVCPMAFYKNIKYTYNGRAVDKKQNIMSLLAM